MKTVSPRAESGRASTICVESLYEMSLPTSQLPQRLLEWGQLTVDGLERSQIDNHVDEV